MFLLATMCVRNEEDIIAHNIEHHIKEGVSKFIITDNNSTDNTREIISRYPQVTIIDEPARNHNQGVWVTKMAKMATMYNPDWIIHMDADEFWCNLHTLDKYKDYDVVYTSNDRMFRHLIPLTPPKSFSMRKMKHYVIDPHFAKIAHKPRRDIVSVSDGNHKLECEGDLKIAVSEEIEWHHYMIRSHEQFRNKVKKASAIFKLWRKPCIGHHWKIWCIMRWLGLLPWRYNKFKKNDKKIILNKEFLGIWPTDHHQFF